MKRNTGTFVLVHGAWHGAWCWSRLGELLRAVGHNVHTPTLTGLGDRAHLAHPGVDLALHVQDVVAFLEAEELNRAVLVGHSYAGMVISGVAAKAANRLSHLVLLADGAPLPYVSAPVGRTNPACRSPKPWPAHKALIRR